VAAIYSAGRQAATTSQARKPLPAPIFHGSDGVGVQLHAFTDDE